MPAKSLTLPEGETIGEFEFTTAVAFLYFVEQGCDIVVLETGLGGRCDATNVIRSPEVCVITPISLDHMAVLGDTVAEIAGERKPESSSPALMSSAQTARRRTLSPYCVMSLRLRVRSGTRARIRCVCFAVI